MRGPPPSKGIIPAGAGRRTDEGLVFAGKRDHPRGCGEKQRCRALCAHQQGSSPRVRGEGTRDDQRPTASGIIPAGAGRSTQADLAARQERDHPRGCGEKSKCQVLSFGPPGSSPRVRGEGRQRGTPLDDDGIIPAGAGRRQSSARRYRRRWDHPRGCGEKRPVFLSAVTKRGSSPRVRGEGVGELDPVVRDGIIPAGAGRSLSERLPASAGWDHPRGCGEKRDQGRARGAGPGSSPRVRGEGPPGGRRPCGVGIIPAGAGRRLEKV